MGCGDRLPDAYGPNQEVMVLADSLSAPWLSKPLKDFFERTVLTPQEEQIYRVNFGNVEDFDHHKRRTNLLVAALLDQPNPTSELVGNLLGPSVKEAVRAGEAGLTWKRNVWAKNQLLMIVTGRDSAHLVSNLRTQADQLYTALEDSRNERTGDLIYSYGEREEVSQELADKYGWTIRVPFGYKVLDEKPDSNFVLLVKEEPARWFFVYWEDNVNPADLTPDWCISKRNEVTSQFFGGDQVGDVDVQEAEFSGKLAVQLSGLWKNDKNWSGGPFKSYAFVDMDTDRFYHVDMGVYAPNKRKESYLRQVDLMAQSFTIQPAVAMP